MLEAILSRVVKKQGGFLAPADVRELTKRDRLRQVLVRCGCGRFVCAAQDAQHFISIIERDYDIGKAGADYIRDVSLLAGDPAFSQYRERQTTSVL